MTTNLDPRGNMGALARATRAVTALVGVGTNPAMDPKQVQGIRLVNQVALFVMVLVLPYLAVFAVLGSCWSAWIQVGAILVLGGAVLLNRYGHHDAARVVTLLLGNGLVLVMTLLLGKESGIHLYAFAAVVAPLFFYSNREWATIGGYVGITVVSSVAAELWLSRHAPVDPLPAWLEPWFFLACLVGGLLTVFAFVLYFYVESRRFEASMVRANHEMKRLAETDALTGVANRRKLERTLLLEWGRAVRGKYMLSVVLIDVDHFKQYNDRHGHPAGDDVLVRLCRAFEQSVRRVYDLVGRYGGEEFLLILPESGPEGAFAAAERARVEVVALAIPHDRNADFGCVTCSFGVASGMPADGGDPYDLVRLADAALYRAKSEGRNRVATATVPTASTA